MTNNVFEVLIIGSGATGGVAAMTYAEKGIKVLMIEAGPELTTEKAIGSEPQNTFRRIKGIINSEHTKQAQHPGFWKANPLLYMNEKDNPYQTPKNKPFIWTQGRQVGGRSLTWGGITLRFGENDFNPSSINKSKNTWPIKYSDLSEHYSYLERTFKIHGNKDKIPQIPDAESIEALPFTEIEEEFREKIKKELGFPFIHSRGFGPSELNNEWPCSSSPGSSLKKAISTNNVKILSNHIAERIVMNKSQTKAKYIIVVDKDTNIKKKLEARIVVLCASTIQSVRLLLNSKENMQSNGLIDPSDSLGYYLMDHISSCKFFSIEKDNNFRSNSNNDKKNVLSGAGSFFIPFGTELPYPEKINFKGGYGIWGGIDRFGLPGWISKISNRKVGFIISHGEVLPCINNKVTLSEKLDKWGIPQPYIDFEWKENEQRMVNHMNYTMNQIIKATNAEIIDFKNIIKAPFARNFISNILALREESPPPGYYIHEVGGARMGDREENSVVDKWNRLWRCKNVLVVDGACWPTSSWQSPTLTMMAITRRACLNSIKHFSD